MTHPSGLAIALTRDHDAYALASDSAAASSASTTPAPIDRANLTQVGRYPDCERIETRHRRGPQTWKRADLNQAHETTRSGLPLHLGTSSSLRTSTHTTSDGAEFGHTRPETLATSPKEAGAVRGSAARPWAYTTMTSVLLPSPQPRVVDLPWPIEPAARIPDRLAPSR